MKILYTSLVSSIKDTDHICVSRSYLLCNILLSPLKLRYIYIFFFLTILFQIFSFYVSLSSELNENNVQHFHPNHKEVSSLNLYITDVLFQSFETCKILSSCHKLDNFCYLELSLQISTCTFTNPPNRVQTFA